MDRNDANDAVQREHHTISTRQVRDIMRTLEDLERRVTALERGETVDESTR